jgi:hypothetical protein
MLLPPTLSLLLATEARADHPLGTELPDSVVVDVSGSTFDSLEGLVVSLVPGYVPIAGVGGLPAFSVADAIGCVPLIGCASEYGLTLSNLYLELEVDQFDLRPDTDALALEVDLTLFLGRSSNPAVFDIYATIIGLDLIDDSCTLYLDPIHLSLDVVMDLRLVNDPNGVDLDGDGNPDTRRLDVDIPPAGWTWDADDNDFNFGGCGTADVVNVINQVTSVFGFNIYDELLGLVEPEIDGVVQQLPGAVEPEIEALFEDLVIDEEIDLLGTPMRLTLWPSTVAAEPTRANGSGGGLRLGMSSLIDVPAAACVEAYGIERSVATPSDPPEIGQDGGLPFAPSAAAWIDDDFVNHVLFAAWKGGLLCYTLSDESEDLALPVPLDTGLLLQLLAGDEFDSVFPTAVPVEITTIPRLPPTLDPGGPHDFDIELKDLGLSLVAEIEGRKSRFVELELDADVGADLTWDDATGAVGVVVALDGSSFTPKVTANDYKPSATATIEGNFTTLFNSVVSPLLGGILGDLTFPMGTIEGIGITELDVASVAGSRDWTGAFVEVGTPTYPATGCDLSQGCDTSSCSGGCSQGGSGGGALLLLAPLAVAALRRRR